MMIMAGFETTAATMSMAFWELALRPDVQARLQEEVDRGVAAAGGIDKAAASIVHHSETEEQEEIRQVGPFRLFAVYDHDLFVWLLALSWVSYRFISCPTRFIAFPSRLRQ